MRYRIGVVRNYDRRPKNGRPKNEEVLMVDRYVVAKVARLWETVARVAQFLARLATHRAYATKLSVISVVSFTRPGDLTTDNTNGSDKADSTSVLSVTSVVKSVRCNSTQAAILVGLRSLRDLGPPYECIGTAGWLGLSRNGEEGLRRVVALLELSRRSPG